MSTSTVGEFEYTIRHLVEEGKSYRNIASYLQVLAGQTRGIFAGSVRQFCASSSIRKRGTVSDVDLEEHIRHQIQQVGHAHGRRTMSELLHFQGIHTSEQGVSNTLRRIAPIAY